MIKKIKGLTFNEKFHSYAYNGNRCISATTLMKKYYKPFDREHWSKHIAERDNKTQAQVLKEWDDKAKESTRFGNLIHKYAESKALGRELPELKSQKELDYAKQVDKFFNNNSAMMPIGVELQICSPTHLIAGMIDLMVENDKGEKFILDWKTSQKIDHYNQYGQMMLPPFDYIDDCELSKYSFQQSIYKKILNTIGINVDTCYLIWLTSDDYKLIECTDYSREVDTIFDLKLKG